MEHLYWLVPLVLGIGAVLFFWWLGRREGPQAQFERARRQFQQNRKELETAFYRAAAATGKPRGLRWKECQWSELIEWVREKQTGQLLAIVGVTIAFEAIEGGEMEGLAAVGNLRNASAVFFLQDGTWQTNGRVIFNLNPDEALVHFKSGYERVTA
jgi:hypothetical protein